MLGMRLNPRGRSLPMAANIALSPSGESLYYVSFEGASICVSAEGCEDFDARTTNAVHHFVRNSAAAGDLRYDGSFVAPGMTYVVKVVVSSDGAAVFVLARDTGTIVWFDRDKSTGSLGYGGMLAPDSLSGALDATPSFDGRALFVASYSSEGLLTRVVRTGPSRGALEFDSAVTVPSSISGSDE